MTLISREPWWLVPPKPGQQEQDLHWGYLEIYADGRAVFVDQRPTDRELAERKSCRNFPTPSRDGSAFQLSQARFQRRNAGFEGFDAVF